MISQTQGVDADRPTQKLMQKYMNNFYRQNALEFSLGRTKIVKYQDWLNTLRIAGYELPSLINESELINQFLTRQPHTILAGKLQLSYKSTMVRLANKLRNREDLRLSIGVGLKFLEFYPDIAEEFLQASESFLGSDVLSRYYNFNYEV